MKLSSYISSAQHLNSSSFPSFTTAQQPFTASPALLLWLESQQSDRYQFISIDICKSPTAPLSQGVPQGSVLGPLLFILYILLLWPNNWLSCTLALLLCQWHSAPHLHQNCHCWHSPYPHQLQHWNQSCPQIFFLWTWLWWIKSHGHRYQISL